MMIKLRGRGTKDKERPIESDIEKWVCAIDKD